MSKKELSRVVVFKRKYSHLCKGKSDEEILVCIRFIKAIQKEIETKATHQRAYLSHMETELANSIN